MSEAIIEGTAKAHNQEKKKLSNKKKNSPWAKDLEAKKPKREIGQTYTLTLEAFLTGKSVEEIAESRNFSPSTIVSHLRRLIGEGRIPIEQLVPEPAFSEWVQMLKENPELNIWGMRERIGDELKFRELIYTHAYLEKLKDISDPITP